MKDKLELELVGVREAIQVAIIRNDKYKLTNLLDEERELMEKLAEL